MKYLLLFFLSVAVSGAALNPTTSVTDWTPGTRTGVPGGIAQYFNGGAATGRDTADQIDISAAPYNADKTGVTNCSAIIATALTDLFVAYGTGNNKVIFFPAGTYKVDTVVSLGHQLDNLTFRGETGTTIVCGGRFIQFGSSGWDAPFAAPARVTAGLSQDSTSITLDDAGEFVSGELILIGFDDQTGNAAITDGGTITFSVGGSYPTVPMRKQVSRITAKAGNVLTISPGIYHAPQAGLGAQVQRNSNNHRHDFVGIEDMTISMASGNTTTSAIAIQHAYGCWVKNVKVTEALNYGIELVDSLQCEIRECWVENAVFVLASNRGGYLVNTVGGCLIEDNISINKFPGIEVNAGTSGSVFAYNLLENEPDPIYSALGSGIDTNHGPHPSHNLYEGNVASSIIADGYFGSVSEDTICRNWFTATDYANQAISYPLSLKRFTRKYNIVGNVIGKNGQTGGYPFDYGLPNIGNGSSTGTAEPTTGDFWADWKATATLTTRTDNTSGAITLISGAAVTAQLLTIRWNSGLNVSTFTSGTVAGSVVPFSSLISGDNLPTVSTVVDVFMQAGGYQERDLDVANSTNDKGNYHYAESGAAGSMSSLAGETLPDSLYRSSKPTFFGALAWPAFSPTAPNASSYESIPAGYRWINAAPPPGGGSGPTVTTGSLSISGALSIGN